MSLRTVVFDALKADPELIALGVSEATLYPTYSVDSPQERRFVILRWLSITPGLLSTHVQDLQIWAYDREPDYDAIVRILKRCRVIMEGLVPALATDVQWNGSSDDLRDDVYSAVTRNESYRIVAGDL